MNDREGYIKNYFCSRLMSRPKCLRAKVGTRDKGLHPSAFKPFPILGVFIVRWLDENPVWSGRVD